MLRSGFVSFAAFVRRTGVTGLLLLLLATAWASPVGAQDLTEMSIEELMELDVIPIDVLGTHIHLRGEWMLGYRYGVMQMEGHSSLDEAFSMQPADMRMQMHMFEVMYGITDRLTLMAMVPLKRRTMQSTMHGGAAFSTTSQGLGDLRLSAHYALYQRGPDYFITSAGVELPTGSIDARDDTPMGTDRRLPYPMQLGTGTTGAWIDLTFIDQFGDWAWGIHADGTFRLGRNAHEYRPGHVYHAGTWLTRRLTDWAAPLFHLDFHAEGDVEGADPLLNPAMAPTADPARQGEAHLDVAPGMSFYVPHGPLEGQRLALKIPFGIWDDHDGAPMERSWSVSLVWKWTFQ